jgi:hypothetical protein
VNFVNWRLLSNGSVILVSFSDAMFQDLKPAVDGVIRGDMIIAGFLLTPLSEGCKVQYVLQLDLKGSIPSSVASLAASSQAMFLANIRKVMDKDKSKAGKMRAANASTNYSGRLFYLLYRIMFDIYDAHRTGVINGG